jgi:hypothetical protein
MNTQVLLCVQGVFGVSSIRVKQVFGASPCVRGQSGRCDRRFSDCSTAGGGEGLATAGALP